MKITKSDPVHYIHNMGECIVNDDNTYGYIPIPKNASTFMRRVVTNLLGWETFGTINDASFGRPMIVCLRDPVDRWCTGVAEYLNIFHSGINIQHESILKFLVERGLFDAHTTPQVDFLHGMDSDNLTFFKCGPNLSTDICSFINTTFDSNIDITQLHPKSIGFTNDSRMFPNKEDNKQILKEYLANNPSYVTRITELYSKDLELIDNVTFYGENKNEEY